MCRPYCLQARALARQINNQVLAMKQAKRQLLMQQEIAADTLAGGK